MLFAIADHVNDKRADKYAWASTSTLAKKCGVTKRQAINLLRSLEKRGEIEIEKKQGCSSRYWVKLEPVKPLSPVQSVSPTGEGSFTPPVKRIAPESLGILTETLEGSSLLHFSFVEQPTAKSQTACLEAVSFPPSRCLRNSERGPRPRLRGWTFSAKPRSSCSTRFRSRRPTGLLSGRSGCSELRSGLRLGPRKIKALHATDIASGKRFLERMDEAKRASQSPESKMAASVAKERFAHLRRT